MLYDHITAAKLVYGEECVSVSVPFVIGNICSQGCVELRSNRKLYNFRNPYRIIVK